MGKVPGLTLRTSKARCFGFQADVSVWQTTTAFAFVPSAPSKGTNFNCVRLLCLIFHFCRDCIDIFPKLGGAKVNH
ncbi:hypothetical protein SLA2020_285790 [Shorea laevis]